MKHFLNIDFMDGSVPDATTLLKFRHLLEEHNIPKKIFDKINKTLDDRGIIMLEE